MKKRFKKLKKKLFRPLVLVPVTLLLAVVLVGGYFLFFAGNDGSDSTASTPQAPAPPTGEGPSGKLQKPKPLQLAPEQPTGKEFTIDSDRAEKDYAIANAVGSIKMPARIDLRIGAAPKQPVAVNASITCLLSNEGSKYNLETFSVTPPVTRELKLPVADAVACTVSVGAQLTQAGRGRIKVFLMGTRRPGG